MNRCLSIILFFSCVVNSLDVICITQEAKKISVKIIKQKRLLIDPTDAEILQYDEAISDQVEVPKISSTLAFAQSIGIEILLGYFAVKRNVHYYFNLLKQALWRIGNSIAKLKG